MMLRSELRRPRRGGFTLVELITVLAIIVVLAALAVGTYFRVRSSQEEAATETILAKIDSQFSQQWKAVLDTAKLEAKNDAMPGNVKAIAGNDPRRAAVIWTKVRLKQEFPQNFWEALEWPRRIGNPATYPYPIPIESKFVKELQGIVPADPATLSVADQFSESAILLFISMGKTRRGIDGFNPTQHVGAHAIGRLTYAGRTFEVFIDTWGNPISFIRWPIGGVWSDINQPPHQARDNRGQNIDPQDPERTLLSSGDWNLAAFQHPNGLAYNPQDPAPPVGPLNLSPVIFSFGRDKRPGVNPLFGERTSDEDDNVYAYRVKSGRGN